MLHGEVDKESKGRGKMLYAGEQGWKIIFGFFAAVVLIVFVLTLLYRAQPKRSGIVEKRKEPATQSVFVTVLSPLDSLRAADISSEICREIGGDSALTRMVIGGTHIYKECSSLADFRTLTEQAIINARRRNLETQAKLLAQITGRVMTDRTPARIFFVGSFDEAPYQSVENRLQGIGETLELRHKVHNRVNIIAFTEKQDTHSRFALDVREYIYDSFRKRGIELHER